MNQAARFMKANVGLSGIGAQCHFYKNEEPDPFLIKVRSPFWTEGSHPYLAQVYNPLSVCSISSAEALIKMHKLYFINISSTISLVKKAIIVISFEQQHHYSQFKFSLRASVQITAPLPPPPPSPPPRPTTRKNVHILFSFVILISLKLDILIH